MKGDFARVTFDPTLHYSHVFQQQGRVLLEADWNEAAAIQLHLLRTLAVDLGGACWAAGDGFSINTNPNPGATDSSGPQPLGKWQLSPGHFYVDGILCENEAACPLAAQWNAPTADDGSGAAGSSFAQTGLLPCALWLDVWERHLSWVEAPTMLDSALNGVDTCSRAQVVWQVRMLNQTQANQLLAGIAEALKNRVNAHGLSDSELTFLTAESGVLQKLIGDGAAGLGLEQIAAAFTGKPDLKHGTCIGLRNLLNARRNLVCPRLSASLPPSSSDPDPCVIAADARYRGCENQLYRVEIHQGAAPVVGGNADPTCLDPNGVVTFKWSRENGSVIFPIAAVGPVTPPAQADTSGNSTMTVTLAAAGRDERLGLAEGDWVELVDDNYTLAQRACPLLQIANLDSTKRVVTLTVPASTGTQPPFTYDKTLHPLLRRWDQRQTGTVALTAGGVIEVTEGSAIDLEDGIQVTFLKGGLYATGDYWVIPARVANGGTLDGELAMLPARGVHHYAVLGMVDANDQYTECCCRVLPICSQQATPNDASQGAAAANAVAAAPTVLTAAPAPAAQPASSAAAAPPVATPPTTATIRTAAAQPASRAAMSARSVPTPPSSASPPPPAPPSPAPPSGSPPAPPPALASGKAAAKTTRARKST